MGLSVSILVSAWHEILSQKLFTLVCNGRSLSSRGGVGVVAGSLKKTESLKKKRKMDAIANKNNNNNLQDYKPNNLVLEKSPSFNSLLHQYHPTANSKSSSSSTNGNGNGLIHHKPLPAITLPEPALLFSPRPISELDAAAVKLQKVYKSYRTRRNLADCAVVVEELWWKALDFASLKRSSVSFFNSDKQESAVAKWARAKTRVAKVGTGLSQNEKAQKLALRHWLEAIDPRHRYGHNLHLYYDVWFQSESSQPFFYWLDIGDGREINVEKCPRTKLQQQCIKYLGPKERESYQVIVEDGKLIYKLSGELVDTIGNCKWIFVLSTSRCLYIGQKKKGQFQHSSFLAGAATTAAGRLVANEGVLQAIWPYSGHYLPTEENFNDFLSFLEDNLIDLTNVKKCAYNEEGSFKTPEDESSPEKTANITTTDNEEVIPVGDKAFSFVRHLSCKWVTGNGPRIGCVRDYPLDLQSRALEQVNLSPRVQTGSFYGPIPSPRPSPMVHVSPRLAYMGHPSPRPHMALA